MNDVAPLWSLALTYLEPRMQKMLFKPFIEPLVPLNLDGQTIILQAKDAVMCELVRNNYGPIIEGVLEEICGQPIEISIIVATDHHQNETEILNQVENIDPLDEIVIFDEVDDVEDDEPIDDIENMIGYELIAQYDLISEEIENLKKQNNRVSSTGVYHSESEMSMQTETATRTEARKSQNLVSSPKRTTTPLAIASPTIEHNSHLNPLYTFERFINGKSNEFAHAAAIAVSQSPGRVYNPLFFYGDVGLGKTHLMHAIGNAILQRNPNTKVLYVPFEHFLTEFIAAIRDKTTLAFQNRYRKVDLLLLDDIQFIEKKERTQEEFFHTFNTLYNAQKQIVICSDRAPKKIPYLADRILTRLEAGLMADFNRPDLETRIAILQSKAYDEGLEVAPEVFSYIAARITSNIRELEGALMQLKARAKMTGNYEFNFDQAISILGNLIDNTSARQISIELIQQIVAAFYKITTDDLISKKRTAELTLPRQIAMYFSRAQTPVSLPKIGESFGGRDHTTVMHAIDKVTEMSNNDPAFKQILQEIERQIVA